MVYVYAVHKLIMVCVYTVHKLMMVYVYAVTDQEKKMVEHWKISRNTCCQQVKCGVGKVSFTRASPLVSHLSYLWYYILHFDLLSFKS